MIKYIQIIYGYFFTMSIIYLFVKLLSFFLPVDLTFYVLTFLLFLVIFRVRPHSDSQNYPFAFDLQLFFQHRN
ncbi:putative membrane protein [Scopulibacillus daqui]|uniref:Membrane protein n=1 Tax=Scopulibacillus daqui TaxID=1469162 RepID=A0ABS2Q0L2_9BACL|nr:putative membrane protein [Scopulibacillus daqui]